ncbi:Hypothetical protein A7982_07467 [Minicystis rosea]|nr:Hypothetical protein A7982_07467 [Minicystis rosea]
MRGAGAYMISIQIEPKQARSTCDVSGVFTTCFEDENGLFVT